MSVYDTRSVPELFADALNQFSKLIRNEIQLAKAEMSAKATQAMMGGAFIAAAGLVAVAALVLVLMALAAWLTELGLSAPVANLLSAVVGLLLSAALGWTGMNRLKPEHLTPDRTIKQLQRDAAAAREHV